MESITDGLYCKVVFDTFWSLNNYLYHLKINIQRNGIKPRLFYNTYISNKVLC